MNHHVVGFDYLRVVAIFSVVWIHGCDSSVLLGWLNGVNGYAVPCFIMMSVFLGLRSLSGRVPDSVAYLKRRVERLLIPLLVWSLAYYGIRYAKCAFLSAGASFEWSIWGVLRGDASYQLWFLPALFLYQSMILFCVRIAWFGTSLKWWIASICLLLSVLLASSDALAVLRGGLGFLFPYYLPFVFLCFPVYWLVERLNREELLRLMYVSLAVLALFLLMFREGYIFLVTYSLVVFLGALVVNLPRNSLVAFLSAHSMGIYLLHGFFLEGGQLLTAVLGVDLSNAVWALALIVLAYVFSAFTSSLLLRISLVRRYSLLG